MGKVQEPSNSECYTPSSEPFKELKFARVIRKKKYCGRGSQNVTTDFNIALVAMATYWKEHRVNFIISLGVLCCVCGRKQKSRK
jgi:hypothetical protein